MREVMVSMMGTRDGNICRAHGAMHVLPITSNTILMTQCAWNSPSPPNVYFWTLAYQAIDD